jgi:hypothetical protein
MLSRIRFLDATTCPPWPSRLMGVAPAWTVASAADLPPKLTLYEAFNVGLRENPGLEMLFGRSSSAGNQSCISQDMRRQPLLPKGTSVLTDARGGSREVIRIASGSEVSPAVDAHEKLVAERRSLASSVDRASGHLRPDTTARKSLQRDSACRDRASQEFQRHTEIEPNYVVAAANALPRRR